MLPLNCKCLVRNKGFGRVEAICNDKPNGGVSFSYLVRLDKEPVKLHWFERELVRQCEELNDEPKKPKETEDHQERSPRKNRQRG